MCPATRTPDSEHLAKADQEIQKMSRLVHQAKMKNPRTSNASLKLTKKTQGISICVPSHKEHSFQVSNSKHLAQEHDDDHEEEKKRGKRT